MHEQMMKPVNQPLFFNRDLSWLSFNARVLAEAQRSSVPVMERLKFLSIFSCNLDEFNRVRMPALLALDRVGPSTDTTKEENILHEINAIIRSQRFGLKKATLVMGGVYHNLKDLASLPLKNKVVNYDAWPRTVYQIKNGVLLFDYLRKNEIES